jgi:hypothetical protein
MLGKERSAAQISGLPAEADRLALLCALADTEDACLKPFSLYVALTATLLFLVYQCTDTQQV